MIKFRKFILLLLILATGIIHSPVLGNRIPTQNGLFYYQPAASVYGAEAAWVNPSILGWYRAASYQIIADYSNSTYAKSWGTVVASSSSLVTSEIVKRPNDEGIIIFENGPTPVTSK